MKLKPTRHIFLFISTISFSTGLILLSALSYAQQIGVYYYPGWSTGTNQPATVASSWSPGWAPIKSFPERKPLLGWYKEGDVNVMTKQLDWMNEYGVDFIAFDWYWSKSKNASNKEHAIKSYLKSPSRSKVSFALLWANHAGVPKNTEQILDVVKYWIINYLNEPGYLHIDEKPVVFIFSANLFEKDANNFGSDTKSQLEIIQNYAKNNGLKDGIFFVAGTKSEDKFAGMQGLTSGYSAVSAYNYHATPEGKQTTNYKELDFAYREHWKRLINNSPLPVILPITVGWDKRPWGGSNNPKHDFSISSLGEFHEHLLAAKSTLDTNILRTCNMAILCCWNEFGEGAFVEPTVKNKFTYLEQIKEIFQED